MTSANGQQEAGENLRLEAWRRIRPWVLVLLFFMSVAFVVMWSLWGTMIFLLILSILWMGAASLETYTRVMAYRQTWLAGAAAEEQVARRLSVLESRGWTIRHNIPKPGGGDVDHIACGPRGVFVIETKAHRGKVAVESGVLTFNKRMPERDSVQQVFQNTLFIKDHLKRELNRSCWIVSVVCLTEAFVNGYRIDIPERKVHVVKVERLIEFLENYDDTRPLNPEQIRQVDCALCRFTGRKPARSK